MTNFDLFMQATWLTMAFLIISGLVILNVRILVEGAYRVQTARLLLDLTKLSKELQVNINAELDKLVPETEHKYSYTAPKRDNMGKFTKKGE